MRTSDAVFIAALAVVAPATASAVNRVFTYQGEVEKNGTPFEGVCDFRFGIFDAATGGSQSGTTQAASATVNGGLFSALINTNDAFDGGTRFLDVSMRCPGGSGSYVGLTPRQELTATPYSFYAPEAGIAGGLQCTGCVGSGEIASGAVTDLQVASGISYAKLTGAPNSLPPSGTAGGALAGTYPNPTLASGSVSTAQILNGALTSDKFAVASVGPDQIATSAVTTDKIADGTIVQSDLSFAPGTVQSVAAGAGLNGGTITQSGTIAVRFGTSSESVAPGDHDHGGTFWQLGGNLGVTPGTDFLGTLGLQALELRAGGTRALSLDPTGDTINFLAGAPANIVTPGIVGVTIGGGGNTSSPNQARSDYATVSGGRGNHAWRNATVGGGQDNQATGVGGTVAGGLLNEAMGEHSAVGGGSGNLTMGELAAIGGGSDNNADGLYAVIGGGYDNLATGRYATIGGGGRTDAMNADSNNRVTDDYGTIGGGGDNTAGNDSGSSDDAVGATVCGGGSNTAGGPHTTVAGGFLNAAFGDQATVGGGTLNLASGPQSTVPGGILNSAEAAVTFAAGANAHATHVAAFVWSDGTAFTGSLAPNTFNARASGGFRFIVNGTGDECTLTSAAGWLCSGASDRRLKENISAIDGADVLARLAKVPVQAWNYKSEGPAVRHIGPMAQDFRDAFQVGADDRMIGTIDADGVALAAVQELYRIVRRQNAALESLRDRNASLELRVVTLEATLPTHGIEPRLVASQLGSARDSSPSTGCGGSAE